MVSLIAWVRSRLSPLVQNIWCIHCQGRRPVRQLEIAEVQTSKRLTKRLVGECKVCGKETSTFIGGDGSDAPVQ